MSEKQLHFNPLLLIHKHVTHNYDLYWKKAKYKALIKAKEKSNGFASLTTITHCFGLKRDAYYKYKNRADKRKEIEQQIINIVKKRRNSLPGEGLLKLSIKK